MDPSRSTAPLFRFSLNKNNVIVSLACHLFRIRLNKNKTALFKININYIIYIIWHGFILYRMIINKNFGTILFLLCLDLLFISFLFRIILNIQICKI